MKKNILAIVLTGMILALASCEKTAVNETTEDRYIMDPADTVGVINNYYLDGYQSRTAADMGNGRTLQAVNLYLDGDMLYVANFAGKCVDVFDAKTMDYQRSISNGDRTLARDVYVKGDYLYVAAGENREVQVFDKKTGKYLTRLGTGTWPDSQISWAGCVAATNDLIFVRDSKEKNVRVFDRAAISTTVANNNTVFARLNTDDYFIGSNMEPKTDSYDMEVIGDSLYAFIPNAGAIYAWSVNEIKNKKNDAVAKVSTSTNVKIRSIAKWKDNKSLFVAMEKDGKIQLAAYSLTDFQHRNFSNPICSFGDKGRVKLPTQPIVAYYDDHLILTNGDKVERWEIHNEPSYILRPKKK